MSKSFYGASEDDALAKYQAWTAAHPNGPPTTDQQQPLNTFLDLWLTATIKPPNGAASTYRNWFRLIRDHIAPRIGRSKLCDLTLYTINDFLRERYDSTGHGRTVEQLRNIIRSALNYAVMGGTITTNPAEHATVPAFQRRRARALTLSQVQALIDAAAGRLDSREPYRTKRTPEDGAGKKWPPIDQRLLCLYLLAVTTGLRKGELLGLRWGDLEGYRLTVQRAVDLKGKVVERTKTEASTATIIIDEPLAAALAAHRRAMQSEKHQEGWKPDGLMFPSSKGTVLGQRNLDRHFKSVLQAAGLPDIRFHDLRHSAGSLMISEGGSLSGASGALRHSNSAVTAKIYVHGNEESIGRAIAGVSGKIRGGE